MDVSDVFLTTESKASAKFAISNLSTPGMGINAKKMTSKIAIKQSTEKPASNAPLGLY